MTTTRNDPVGPARPLAEPASESVDLMPRVFARWCRVESPIGDVFVAATDQGVCYLRTVTSVGDDRSFVESLRERFGRPARHVARPPAGVVPALRSGRPGRVVFDFGGVSDFDRAVLEATARIPVGEVRPYGWVAQEIRRPKAVRAVAAALGRNPVPLLIPCHRVIRADGDIGGYMFGGPLKERLLRLENVNMDQLSERADDGVFFVGSDTTRIVCFPTCHHARRITPAHLRGFRTFEKARRAGYRPCKHCRPSGAWEGADGTVASKPL